MDKLSELDSLVWKATDDTVVKAWNAYIKHIDPNEEKGRIFPNDIKELVSYTGWDVNMLANALKYADYMSNNRYVYVDENGKLASFNEVSDINSPVDSNALVKYIVENGDETGLFDKDLVIKRFVHLYYRFMDIDVRRHAARVLYRLVEEGTDIITANWNTLLDKVHEEL